MTTKYKTIAKTKYHSSEAVWLLPVHLLHCDCCL